uniref:Uncharacterized protein n=1 Tax=Nelumbo nucifera TaxID=4432 RepID=A0A822ZKV3_NELNU|nr:TPA_asm: hypothetical protein HUJ06_002421 [Nelumbo nucifera]
MFVYKLKKKTRGTSPPLLLTKKKIINKTQLVLRPSFYRVRTPKDAEPS